MKRPGDADVMIYGEREQMHHSDQYCTEANCFQDKHGARAPFRDVDVINFRQQTREHADSEKKVSCVAHRVRTLTLKHFIAMFESSSVFCGERNPIKNLKDAR